MHATTEHTNIYFFRVHINSTKTKIIIISHVGRPKGKKVKELSLKPISEDLRKKLNVRVKLITENIYEIKNKDYLEKFDEEILILENIPIIKELKKLELFKKKINKMKILYWRLHDT